MTRTFLLKNPYGDYPKCVKVNANTIEQAKRKLAKRFYDDEVKEVGFAFHDISRAEAKVFKPVKTCKKVEIIIR